MDRTAEIPAFDPRIDLAGLVRYLNDQVLSCHNTVLLGGAQEPYYRAAREEKNRDGILNQVPAQIEFRQDYVRSALHELAHWCIAGRERRHMDDYGYWYAPDGRTPEQQKAFFSVEIKPQALEQIFCQALGIDFCISVDNLGGEPPGAQEISEFIQAIAEQRKRWQQQGLPPRATAILTALREFADSLALNSPKEVRSA